MSKYFKLQEFTNTSKPFKNELPSELIDVANYTLEHLDKVRELINLPITISSGYRSFQVNKSVGGVSTSQHCLAEAIDIICKLDNKDLFLKIVNSTIEYDQIIYEGTWVHISFKKQGNRKQPLIKQGKGYINYIKGQSL